MSKCKIFLTLVASSAFQPCRQWRIRLRVIPTHSTLQKIELKPASVIDMSRAYKTAAVCFLGVGDCDNEISYGKGGDGEDYTIDTLRNAKTRGSS